MLDEAPAGARMGVGTTLQCVTGRLASIEEVVDWQPFDHVGYRVVLPEVGIIEATYDLEEIPEGTAIRHRWAADAAVDRALAAQAAAAARRVALDRLGAAIESGDRESLAEPVR